ncbi:MAG: cysteine desulfurase family protein [Candidatus Falkowbacteria bacterium]|nr:cysteine desulfurase family protein [Candidatus Falkowbacteria bacterium]
MIYFDYSATTPLDPKVLKSMTPYFSKDFFNPASIHSAGQKALKAVEDARYKIARLIGSRGSEIVFTSGATEANNLALRGLLEGALSKGDKRKHIISTSIEHSSILEPLNDLKKKGYKVDLLPVDKNGLVSLSVLEKAITEDTILISIGYVNSEVGSIQPLNRFGRLIKKLNSHRYETWLKLSTRKRGDKPRPMYFHSDATQAFNVIDCDINKLHLDLMSLSGHKLYGPKGVGLLFVRRGTILKPQQLGGHQERNLRSGTLNVPAIVGLAQAMIIAQKNRVTFNNKISKLRDTFIKSLLKLEPSLMITVKSFALSAMHANIIFPKVQGDALLSALDEKGIAVSAGSACASGDLEASHVLVALGYEKSLAQSALRFTFGRITNIKEVNQAVKIVSLAYRACLRRG